MEAKEAPEEVGGRSQVPMAKMAKVGKIVVEPRPGMGDRAARAGTDRMPLEERVAKVAKVAKVGTPTSVGDRIKARVARVETAVTPVAPPVEMAEKVGTAVTVVLVPELQGLAVRRVPAQLELKGLEGLEVWELKMEGQETPETPGG